MAEKDTKSTTKTKSSASAKSEPTKATAKTTATKATTAKAEPKTKSTATKTTAKADSAVKPASSAKSTAEKSTAKSATAKSEPSAEAKSTAKATAAKPEPKATEKAAAKPAKETAEKKASEKPADKTAAPAKEKTTKSESKPAKSSGKAEKAKASSASDKKSAKSGSKSGGALAAIGPQKLRAIIISAVSVLLVVIIVIGIVLGAKSCNKGVDPYHYNYARFNDDANYMVKDYDDSDWEGVLASALTDGLEKGTSRAPQTSEYLGTVTPVKPVKGVYDEHEIYGVRQYPYYGRNLTGYTVSERDGLIKESHALAPSATWKSLGIYNGIDSEGYLLKNGVRVTYGGAVVDPGEEEEGEGEDISGGFEEGEGEELETGSTSVNDQYKGTYRRLYEHTASLTMYGGGLSKDEPRVIKKITFVNQSKLDSSQLTGLYAPAGEVIKIEMSLADYQKAGGLIVIIGQSYNLYQHVSMEVSGSGIKGTGLCRMPDIVSRFELNNATKNVTIEGDKITAYVGSFLGGPIYVRPIKNNSGGGRYEQQMSVTISGGVRYQHFILGSTTEEEYNANKASTAPYFDLEIYDSVRFTTHKYAKPSENGKALKDYSYADCTDSAILWDKISQVSKRVGGNGLSSGSSQINIIGDCYVAAGAAFANPGRNGVVCPPGWLPDALEYSKFIDGGSWGTMHEYNHCWQGYGVANNGEVTNNATTLISYSLYTRISAGRTAAVGWAAGGWNRFTDPSRALGELLDGGKNGSKRYDLSVYATLLHNIGQDSFIAAGHGGGGGNYLNNLVNATHYDMSYYFTEVMNFGVGNAYSPSGTIAKSQIESAKANNYPMFVPVSSVYQVGRSVIYDNEKRYITTAQPYSYGSGEFIMDFNNHNNFKQSGFTHKNLVIPDGFTVSVVSVTQPANGKVEMLDGNYVKYTPKSGEDGLYSGNFRVKLRIIKDDKAFIVEDVDLVINLKQSAGTQLYRTTYVYETAEAVPDTAAIYNAQTKQFNFGSFTSTENKINVCTQETNTQIWAGGRNYDDAVYNDKSTNYRLMPNNQTLQMLEGTMYFSSAGTYRFTMKGRGKATLYLSFDGGATWESAFTFDRTNTNNNKYVNTEFCERTLTEARSYVQFKVVLLVTKESDFFGIGVSRQNANGTFPDFTNASAIYNAEIHKAALEDSAKKFETDYRYKAEYRYAFTGSVNNDVTKNKLISVSHQPWDNTRLIDFLFDGKSDTYYHSQGGADNYITEEKPFELVVDLGELQKVNRITFNGYSGSIGNNGMVKSFEVYGSTDNKNYFKLVGFTDAPTDKRVQGCNFDTTEIRYYKLRVTKTDNGRYFAMNSIVFSYTLSAGTGILNAPNEARIRYVGDGWTANSSFSTFGLTYVGGVGDSVEYHFKGSRAAYFANSLSDYGTVDIYLDGKLVAENITLGNNTGMSVTQSFKNQYNENVYNATGSLVYMYTGDALSGEHVLKVVGKSGKFSVESFAYWS